MLLLAHLLLLARARPPSDGLDVAVALLFPPLDQWQIWSGWLALLLMIIFPTKFRLPRRPGLSSWRRVHRMAGPAVLIALVYA